MTAIVLYPRGFVGFDIGLEPKTRGPDTMGFLNGLRLNKPVLQKNKTFVSNTEVENIWNQYKTGDKFLNSFGFRKKILQTALSAFGTSSFYEWCLLQTQNPYSTDMQKRFINDTFNFIRTGKRSVTISSWLTLVNVSNEASSTQDDVQIQIEDFFGTRLPIHAQTEKQVSATICRWLANRNGFEDLVGTLHVFFGDKDLH